MLKWGFILGLFFGALFWTHFCIQLGSEWEGGLFSKITLPPPSHTLPPRSFPKGNPLSVNLSVLKALSGTLPPSSFPEGNPFAQPLNAKGTFRNTCSGKADRKVPKVTIEALEEKM